MTVVKKCALVVAIAVPALAACGETNAPNITPEWRAKAADDLFTERVVGLNKDLIENHISQMDERRARLFVDATLNEFNQCASFRTAQADAPNGVASTAQASAENIERHRDMFLLAAQQVFDGNLETAGTTVHSVQPQSISLQQELSDMDGKERHIWERRCTQLEAALESEIEKQAHLRLTPIEIEVRAHKLAANQK